MSNNSKNENQVIIHEKCTQCIDVQKQISFAHIICTYLTLVFVSEYKLHRAWTVKIFFAGGVNCSNALSSTSVISQ